MDNWRLIKEFYNKSFGFPDGLVELASVSDVLLMCVSGSSNETISNFFKMSIEEVDTIIQEWLNFSGWIEDLDTNPYSIYTGLISNGYYSIDDFAEELKSEYDCELDGEFIKYNYKACSLYYRYENRINNEWY